jgi:serine/threonine protein phosphatase PrpC
MHPAPGGTDDPDLTQATLTEESCLHANVSYCLGQTELKGEDVVFLEHRRPWPGRSEESFCGSKSREGGSTTLHDGNCGECGFNLSEYSLFCVFDGHNGYHAAKHSGDLVRDTLEKHLPRGNTPPVTHPDYVEWRELIQRALAITLVELNGTFAEKGIHAGCTATLVLVTGWLVTCINLGDSHACLDTGLQLVQLTKDHRVASNKLDRRRVELTGAIVAPVSMSGSGPADAYSPGLGPLRVWPGGLCISRAIGDFDVGPSIVPFGHITQALVPSRGGRILIASDGVWDAFPKMKKAGTMTRTWPLDVAPSKLISTIVRMHGMVKDDTSLVVVDILPNGQGADFPEMVVRAKKEGSTGSMIPISMPKGSGSGFFCSCFGGSRANAGNNNSMHGGSHIFDESVRGSTMLDDSVRSGNSFKSQSSMNGRGWAGCVISEVDVAEVLDLMPAPSSQEEGLAPARPPWLVEELKDALLEAATFASDTWLEFTGRVPSKDTSHRPAKVSFADDVSSKPSGMRRQSSEFFTDSVLRQSDSAEFGVKFGHYRPDMSHVQRNASTRLPLAQLPEEDKGQGFASAPASNPITDMSVRAGRVYNSEASVRAGLQFKKKNVEDPSVRLRGSNLEGSVHMKAYDVEITPDSSTNEGKLFPQDGLANGTSPDGMLKTTTVRRAGKGKH